MLYSNFLTFSKFKHVMLQAAEEAVSKLKCLVFYEAQIRSKR